MLPKVSKEVIIEVLKGTERPQNVRESWGEMIANNPELFGCLTEIAVRASLKEEMRGEMFLRGALCVWETLRVQDEIDDMDDNWSV